MRKKFICIVIALILVVLSGCSENPIRNEIDKIIESYNHRNEMAQNAIDNYTDDDYVKLCNAYMELDTNDIYVRFYGLSSYSDEEISRYTKTLNTSELEIYNKCKSEYEAIGLKTLKEKFSKD